MADESPTDQPADPELDESASAFVMPDRVDRIALSMCSWGLCDFWVYNFAGGASKEERTPLWRRPGRSGGEVLVGEPEFDPEEFTRLVRKLRKLPLAGPMHGDQDIFATDLETWQLDIEGGGLQASVSGYGVTHAGIGDTGEGAVALRQAIRLIQSLGRRVIWEQRIVPDDGKQRK